MADDESTLAGTAAHAVVREAASLAVVFALSWVIMHPDLLRRALARLSARRVSDAEARARRETAELAREISAWEHSC